MQDFFCQLWFSNCYLSKHVFEGTIKKTGNHSSICESHFQISIDKVEQLFWCIWHFGFRVLHWKKTHHNTFSGFSGLKCGEPQDLHYKGGVTCLFWTPQPVLVDPYKGLFGEKTATAAFFLNGNDLSIQTMPTKCNIPRKMQIINRKRNKQINLLINSLVNASMK